MNDIFYDEYDDQYIPIEEACEMLQVEETHFHTLARKHGIRKKKIKAENSYKKYHYYSYDVEALKEKRDNSRNPYGSIVLEFDEVLKPIILVNQYSFLPRHFKPSQQYAISSKGRVFNLTQGRELKQIKDKDGYMIVNLAVGGNNETIKVNTLMGAYYCENHHNWVDTHHKNKDRADNRSENILPVNHPDHVKLHSIEDEAEYQREMDRIERENRYTEEEKKSIVILDPEFSREKSVTLLRITLEGYKRYIKEGNFLPTDILMQYSCPNTSKRETKNASKNV